MKRKSRRKKNIEEDITKTRISNMKMNKIISILRDKKIKCQIPTSNILLFPMI